jgi:transposase
VPGRSRGGYGSKIHPVVDGKGVPMAVTVTAGRWHESTRFEAVMGQVRVPRRVGRPRCRPRKLAGDRGFSYPRVRRELRRRRTEAVIPTRKDQRRLPRFEEAAYRRRNVVERCIGWLKESRRLATRFEKLAENLPARVKLAMLERLLKALLPDRPESYYLTSVVDIAADHIGDLYFEQDRKDNAVRKYASFTEFLENFDPSLHEQISDQFLATGVDGVVLIEDTDSAGAQPGLEAVLLFGPGCATKTAAEAEGLFPDDLPSRGQRATAYYEVPVLPGPGPV